MTLKGIRITTSNAANSTFTVEMVNANTETKKTPLNKTVASSKDYFPKVVRLIKNL